MCTRQVHPSEPVPVRAQPPAVAVPRLRSRRRRTLLPPPQRHRRRPAPVLLRVRLKLGGLQRTASRYHRYGHAFAVVVLQVAVVVLQLLVVVVLQVVVVVGGVAGGGGGVTGGGDGGVVHMMLRGIASRLSVTRRQATACSDGPTFRKTPCAPATASASSGAAAPRSSAPRTPPCCPDLHNRFSYVIPLAVTPLETAPSTPPSSLCAVSGAGLGARRRRCARHCHVTHGRHFNYLGDLLLSLSMCMTCGFDHTLP
jgi:hypothetical protein